ncbi:MAG: hypothetical protein LBB98_03275 [Treponema sp.]|jgi:hypothetical protein|nr:hypothetical protein [Treponema sp.]
MKFFNLLKRGNSYSIALRHFEFFLFFITPPVLLILILFGFFFRHEIVEITKNQREITLRQYASGIREGLPRKKGLLRGNSMDTSD